MAIRNYRDLDAWKKAMDFVEQVYYVTRVFPKEEVYGLTIQLRRAVLSIACNVAEGQGRGADKEFVYFLRIAHGSLREVETQLEVARRLSYLDAETIEKLMSLASEVGRLINGLTRKIGGN